MEGGKERTLLMLFSCLQTLPVSPTSPTSKQSPSASPSHPPSLPEESEASPPTAAPDFSGGKTWPRRAKQPTRLSDTPSSSQDVTPPDHTPNTSTPHSPKTEGAPTRYEQVGNPEDRTEVLYHSPSASTAAAIAATAGPTHWLSPSHKENFVAHSTSEPLQRKSPNSKSSSNIGPGAGDSQDPQFCLKFTPMSESPLPPDHTPSPSSSSSSRPEAAEILMMSSGWSVKSRRPMSARHHTPSDTNHLMPRDSSETTAQVVTSDEFPRSQSIAHRRVGAEGGRGREEVDLGGGLAAYFAKMRALGHRRSSSAPINKPSSPQDDHTFPGHDQGSSALLLSGKGGGAGVGVASSRNRQLV